MADVRTVVHPQAIAELVRSPEMRAGLLEAAEPVVRGAAARAPRRTGAGAASIRAEAVLDGPMWTARVAWSRERFYMYFHEVGTRYLAPRPFLVPTLEGLSE